MTEEKISFEVARLAKEKGFDVPTLYCFLLDGSEQISSGDEGDYALYNHNLWDYYSRPTQSLLAKWLREVHRLFVEITYVDDLLGYGFKVTDLTTNTELTPFVYKDGYFKLGGFSLEECFEEGLKLGLKLIK